MSTLTPISALIPLTLSWLVLNTLGSWLLSVVNSWLLSVVDSWLLSVVGSRLLSIVGTSRLLELVSGVVGHSGSCGRHIVVVVGLLLVPNKYRGITQK
jgi:hypothetical protein